MATTQTLPTALTDWYKSVNNNTVPQATGMLTQAGSTHVNPATYNPTTLSDPTKWDVTDDQSAAYQMESIINKDSPLMQLANTRGLQQANQRGLLNSSMAVGAAQDSVISTAMPLAQFDADVKAKAAGYNAETANTFARTNAEMENSAKVFGAQSINRANEFNAGNEFTKQESARQRSFEAAEAQKNRLLEISQLQKQLDAEASRLQQELAFKANQGMLQRDFDAEQAEKNRLLEISQLQKQLDAEASQRQKQLDAEASRLQQQMGFEGSQSQLQREFESSQSQLQRELESSQSQLQRDFDEKQALFESNVKASLAQIENEAQFDRQSQNIYGGLGQEFTRAMTSINQDNNMNQQSKDYAINQLFDAYKAQISLLSAVGSVPDVSELLIASGPATPGSGAAVDSRPKTKENFSGSAYLQAHPDVARDAYWSQRPWEHYLTYGRNGTHEFTYN